MALTNLPISDANVLGKVLYYFEVKAPKRLRYLHQLIPLPLRGHENVSIVKLFREAAGSENHT